MRIALLGCGAMGRAAAYAFAANPSVDELVLLDRDSARTATVRAWLAHAENRCRTAAVDVRDRARLVKVLGGVDVCAAALPWAETACAIEAALAARRPLASITRPEYAALPALDEQVRAVEGRILVACGLEPGLTEILARRVAEQLATVQVLGIRCGGIPARREGPLYHSILFGSRLPVAMRDAYVVEDNCLTVATRFSGRETLQVDGVGRLEAHHDGLVPWVMDDPVIGRIPRITQKTIRWPGFTERVLVLHDLGLLSDDPLECGGARVAPRAFVEAVLARHPSLTSSRPDITILRVEAEGTDGDGRPALARLESVVRYDPASTLTGMARLTGFTLASVTVLLGAGLMPERGLLFPNRAIVGELRTRLVDDLNRWGIHFEVTRSVPSRS